MTTNKTSNQPKQPYKHENNEAILESGPGKRTFTFYCSERSRSRNPIFNQRSIITVASRSNIVFAGFHSKLDFYLESKIGKSTNDAFIMSTSTVLEKQANSRKGIDSPAVIF